MLGHRVWLAADRRGPAWATVRAPMLTPALATVLPGDRAIVGVAADDLEGVSQAMDRARPDLVVNCVGVVKQADEASDPVPSIIVNSLFPHRLAALCRERGARLVHISTDCVFSGRRGSYGEDDLPDPVDLYGRSKLLGEAAGPGSLTVRTSFIGRELAGGRGLLEWFLSKRGGHAPGFTRAVFSGLTTAAAAEAVLDLGTGDRAIEGVVHLAGPPVDKYRLLVMLRDAYGIDVDVVPDESVVIDRSLNGAMLEARSGWRPPTWEAMIPELTADPFPYEQVRAEAC